MKLFLVIPALQKGGVERVVSVLSQEWAKAHTVKIVVFDSNMLSYPYDGKIVDLKLPAKERFFSKLLQSFRRIIKLAKLLKGEKPDHIFSFMESANFPSIFASLLTKNLKRLKVSVHTDPAMMTKFHSLLIPYLYCYPNKIVAVSKGVSNALIKMGVPKEKMSIIYNPLPSNIPLISKSLPKPINVSKKYILGVGNLFQYKGFNYLIEAFSKIYDPNIHLIILGEGEQRKNLENIISNKGLSDRVHLLGLVNEIWPWYRHAKLFVSSSLTESWGNVIVESMSQNCPVIAFDCDFGPREIITHNHNGLLVKVRDVQSLTKSINTLLFDNSLSNKLSNNGLARSKQFDSKALSIKWLKNT